ncbi:hypothetical protein V1278_002631 [Bradyrhizobium sp. AZCC 1577]
MTTIDGGRLARVASRHGATTSQIALAWLLALSPAMIAIPGTGSIAHLEENTAAGDVVLTKEDRADLASMSPSSLIKPLDASTRHRLTLRRRGHPRWPLWCRPSSSPEYPYPLHAFPSDWGACRWRLRPGTSAATRRPPWYGDAERIPSMEEMPLSRHKAPPSAHPFRRPRIQSKSRRRGRRCRCGRY